MEKEDQLTDFLAVGFHAFQTAYYFPWTTLRRAWLANRTCWLDTHQIIYAPNPVENPRYYSHSVCIPIGVLRNALFSAMCSDLRETP